MQVQSLAQEDPLEEGMATYSSIFIWRILWTEEHDRLLDVTKSTLHTCMVVLFLVF